MKIILPGNPISTNHIYKRHGNIIYLSKQGKDLKEYYALEARLQRQGEKFVSGNLEVIIKLYFGDKRIRDIDNYNKILLDSLTGILWDDDKQIQKMTVEKYYDKENPRIEIEII